MIMPSWLPSTPYPPPNQPGYWDPVTATLTWCEEKYYATYYSAEIVNTLTNLLFLYLAYKGIKSCKKHGHDSVFAIAYSGYFLVGIGSFMFHTTLKYPWQLVDELNMIYTTCLMIYAGLSYSQSAGFRITLATLLIGLSVFITAYYHYLQDPTFHQNAYALLTAFIVFRSMFVMEYTLRPSLRRTEEKHMLEMQKSSPKSPAEDKRRKEIQRQENIRDTEILMQMWIFVAFGLTVFLGGFGIWALDNVYCGTLRKWRRSLGLPWGVVLEGHGWWHLMTGLGAYCYIVWGIWLRHCLNGRQDEYQLVWPHFFSLPEIVRFKNLQIDEDGSIPNGYIKKQA